MRAALLLGASVLAVAECASAMVMPGVHGLTPFARLPTNQTITFGAETLTGFGGYHLPTGTTMTDVRNAAGVSSNDFRLNPFDNDIVPGSTYGGPAPAYNGPYTAILSDGLSTGGLTITIAPNVSTVKSHYNFSAGDNPDTATSFQLATVLGSASNIHLGDTVVMRAGNGATGLTPALNPVSSNTSRYTLVTPSTAYASGAGPNGSNILVTCETVATGYDADGNPVEGSPCQVGGLVLKGSSTAYTTTPPYLFDHLWFYDDAPASPSFVPTPMLTGYGPGTYLAEGFGCQFCKFELGSAITQGDAFATGRVGLSMIGGGVADHNRFIGPFVAGLYVNSPASLPLQITANVGSGMSEDAVDITPGAYTSVDIENNFFYSWNAKSPAPVAGDTYTINGTVYTYVASGPYALNQIPLSPLNGPQSLANTVCTINAGASPTVPVSSNYPTGNFPCVAGVNYPMGQSANPNVVASFSSSPPTLTMKLTSLVSTTPTVSLSNILYATTKTSTGAVGSWSGSGVGANATITYTPGHSDTFQWEICNAGLSATAGTFKGNISVRGANPPNDGNMQFYFGNGINCTMNGGDIEHNLSYQIAGNQIYLQNFTSPVVKFNTDLADVYSNGYATSDPTYDTIFNPTYVQSIFAAANGTYATSSGPAGTGGGTWSYNLSNATGAANQLGTPLTLTPSIQEAMALVGLSTDQAALIGIMPHVSTTDAPLTNRAAAIQALAPAYTPQLYNVTITAGSTSATVTADTATSTIPPNTPVNCANSGAVTLATGDLALTTSAGAATFRYQAVGSGSATYVCGIGAFNPDGTVNGALFPADNAGVIGWNDGNPFVPSATHTPAQ